MIDIDVDNLTWNWVIMSSTENDKEASINKMLVVSLKFLGSRDEISPRIAGIPPISNFDLCTKV